ncbi:MAG: beta-ketoacyl-ACP synthase III [Pseudomonadota bacterium]|uniref:Beta-ketoacyl-[acyl-carrier-protein] synthase III n=1 Tax=Candidatus Desulfatibia profunda TaxID=2841695 RepID=A0A8J6NX00_9BACT|nr:ketoacyl-ACP synthase III [Candidatus Desulfatibia profunda]MBL7179402.1 ketoacyl-ACP synthase III [Desulfobacterales bacterium]
MKKSIIKSTGRFLPPRVVTNHDLEQWMDTSDEWIRQRTGIEKRHWIPEAGGVGSSDLGLEAAKIALERAGWQPEDIDLIIFGTLSPDIFFPGSGCLLQHKLGLETTPALDIRQQCTGFLYGLATADAFIRSGYFNRILFVGAEVHSTGLDISTRGRDVAVIFGDGAGAVCLEGVETDEAVGIVAARLHSQGEFADILTVEVPSHKLNPSINAEMIKEGRHYPFMDGRAVFKTAVRRLPQVAEATTKAAGLSIDDIDLFIPHQANLRINQAFAKAMSLPEEKVFHNIQQYGNTTAASIPIALDEAIEKNIIGRGSTVMFLALGAGLTWGAVIYRFPK